MLLFRSHRCNATKRNPEREARLLYLFEDLSDAQLQAEILKKTAGAEDEAKTRTEIRGLIDGFRTQITTIIANGDVMDPANADTTPDSSTFANLFLTEEKVIKSDAALQTLYRSKLEDHRGTLHPHFERDFNNTRLAIDTALNDKKKALVAELKVFIEAGDLTTGKPFRRRKDAVDAFVKSKAAKPGDLALINTLPADRDRFEAEANKAIYEEHNNKPRAAPLIAEINDALMLVSEHRDAMSKIIEKIDASKANHKDKAEMREQLKVGDEILAIRKADFQILLAQATMLDDWQRGQTEPDKFLPKLEATVVNPAERAEVNTHFSHKVSSTTHATSATWAVANASDKMKAVEEIKEDDVIAVCIAEEIKRIQKHLEDCKKEIEILQIPEICENYLKFFEALETPPENIDPNQEDSSLINNFKNLYQNLGITWMTPMQMYMGWKKYWETRKATRDENDRREAAKFGQMVGDVVGFFSPFKKFENDVKQTLKATVDGEDNKAKDGFKELLKSGPAKFDDLFAPGGEYEKNIHDYNRTRAVLEYAAANGWLYNIDFRNKVVMGRRLHAGRSLPPGTDDDVEHYIEGLRDSNVSGMNSERKRGSDTVDRDGEWDKILGAYKDQLSKHNYMAAIGIFDRSIGKGKKSDGVALLTVTFVRHLRDNPLARKYINKDIIDALQGIGYSSPLFTPAVITKQLPRVLEKEARGAPNAMEEGGEFTSTIAKLERRIRSLQPGISKQGLDECIAKILCGQTVTKEKDGDPEWSQAVSIFDREFKAYRDYYERNVRANDVTYGKLQDYLSNSELILVGSEIFNQIMVIVSTDDWGDKKLAPQFAADILQRFDTIWEQYKKGKIDKEAVKNFQLKFQTLFQNYFANTPRARLASQYNYTTKVNGKEVKIFEEMYLRNLISDSTLNQFSKEDKAKGREKNFLAETILRENAGKPKFVVP